MTSVDGERSTLSWERFAAEVAAILELEPEAVAPTSRLIEDLAFDSLALTELVVVFIDGLDMDSVSRTLETRRWENVTVRELYDEYLTGRPAGMPSATSSTGRPPR